MMDFLRKLRAGGKIVRAQECSETVIREARSLGRDLVDGDEGHYIYVSEESSDILRTRKITDDRWELLKGRDVVAAGSAEFVCAAARLIRGS